MATRDVFKFPDLQVVRDPFSGWKTTAEGRWRFDFAWAPGMRDGKGLYVIHVYDATGTLLVAGIPLVADRDLLRRHRARGNGKLLPTARLEVSIGSPPGDPERLDLGARVQVALVQD